MLKDNILLCPIREPDVIATQRFGNYNTLYGRGFHSGGDLARKNPADTFRTKIMSPGIGKIITSQWQDDKDHTAGYGQYVVFVPDAYPWLGIIMAHQDERLVRSGDRVTHDTQIGFVGNTGFSKGAHLHIEYRPLDHIFDGNYSIPPWFHVNKNGIFCPMDLNML